MSIHDLSVTNELLGHTNLIRGVDFAEDSAAIITSSLDGTARIWNLNSFNPDPLIIDLGIPLHHARLSYDGKYAVTESGSIKVWDAKTGSPLATLASESLVTSTSFDLPGHNILCARDSDGDLRFWHMDSMSTVELKEHLGHVNAARFSGPTGYIVSGGWDGWKSNAPGCIRIWDAETGLHLAALGHPGETGRSIEVSHDGNYAVCLITQGHQRFIRVIDLITGAVQLIEGQALTFGIHPTLPYVAVSYGNEIKVIHLSTGKLLHSVASPQGLTDSRILWSQSDSGWGTLFVQTMEDQSPSYIALDAGSGNQTGRVPGRYLILDHNRQELLSFQDESGHLKTYDLESLNEIETSPLHGLRPGKLTLGMNGDLIASSVPNDQAIMLWNADSLDRVAVLGGDGYVSDLSWSGDKQRLIATWDESIIILDAKSIGERAMMRSHLQHSLGMSNSLYSNNSIDIDQHQFILKRTSDIQRMIKGLKQQ